MILCPLCGLCPDREFGNIKIVWMDGEKRAFRRHKVRGCNRLVGLPREAEAVVR